MKARARISITVLSGILMLYALAANAQLDKEMEAVKKTIVAGYVKGIHIDRDVPAVKSGFHPQFMMFIKKDEDVRHFSLPSWIDSMEKRKKSDPAPPKQKITWEIPLVDITGDAAVARVEIFRDGKHIYTDYMSLYKFEDGWKIVGKIYFSHK